MQKRVMLATILGLVCGVICLLLGHYAGGTEWSVPFVLSGLANRGMMGVVIGVAAVKMSPFLRGPMFGLLMSLGPAIALYTPDKTVPYIVAGTIYGFLIDVLTSKAFKADVAA
jgi:hypothetical protein